MGNGHGGAGGEGENDNTSTDSKSSSTSYAATGTAFYDVDIGDTFPTDFANPADLSVSNFFHRVDSPELGTITCARFPPFTSFHLPLAANIGTNSQIVNTGL